MIIDKKPIRIWTDRFFTIIFSKILNKNTITFCEILFPSDKIINFYCVHIHIFLLKKDEYSASNIKTISAINKITAVILRWPLNLSLKTRYKNAINYYSASVYNPIITWKCVLDKIKNTLQR